MLFNSHEFIFAFLPFVLVGWYLLRPPTVRLAFLTLCSWFFYAWWDWRFLPLMISSTTVDYIAGSSAYLRRGPHAGSDVVSSGAEELYGVQTGVLAQT